MYQEECPRLSLLQARSQFLAREWLKKQHISLRCGGQRVTVEIVVEKSDGAFGKTRRWFRCPRCARKTSVIGFSYVGPGCKRCLRWRPRRNIPVDAPKAPHLAPVVVGPCVDKTD